MLKNRVSIHDVAAASNVSHQTVSRVINDHKNVSVKTRTKVLQAIEKLDYRPNSAARALSNGRTMTIGVLSYDSTLHGPASMLHAVQNAASQVGYSVSLASVKSIEPEVIIARGRELVNSGVDGLILIFPISGIDLFTINYIEGFPVVVVEGEGSNKIPSVNVDQFLGAQAAVKHLIDLGHRKIVHIAGPENWYESQRRLEGFEQALVSAGIKKSTHVFGDWSAKSGYHAIDEIIAKSTFSAVFAANDSMAIGAMKRLQELSLRVPLDISVVGFDDLAESAFLTPSLTTVHQEFEKVGVMALELLIDIINKKGRNTFQLRISPELIIRGSTAAYSNQNNTKVK